MKQRHAEANEDDKKALADVQVFFLASVNHDFAKKIVMEQDKTKNILERKQIFLRKKFF